MWMDEERPIDLYDIDGCVFAGFDAVTLDDNDCIYVGEYYKTDEDDYEESLEIEVVERLRASLRKRLVPLGFWNEDEFKIWCVFVVS